MRYIKEIIVHCSATKPTHDISAADVDRWHKQRGWSGIGYHYFVKLDGTIEKGRLVEKMGAHAKGYNRNSIGVCYAGGVSQFGNPQDTRTSEQKKALKNLLTTLKNIYPDAKIKGHNNYPGVTKACPSFDAEKEYKEL